MTPSLPLSFPALRRVHQKEKGAHRSVPQGDFHTMFNTVKAVPPQPDVAFIKEGFQIFTPAQAAMVMRDCMYDRQRKIDLHHVVTLRQVMERNGWAPKDKIDFARLPDGKLILVNGNHRMTAQAGQPRSIEWTVVIHECASFDQVHQLYFKFDTNLRKRSENNILQGVGFAEAHGLKTTTATALYRAAPLIHSGMNFTPYQSAKPDQLAMARIVDVRLQFAEKYAEEARKIEKWLAFAAPNIRSKFKGAGVMAVALVTTKHQPEAAERFWLGMFKNDRLARGDARSTLHADMLSRSYSNGMQVQTVVVPAKAWSAFFTGRPLKIIKAAAGQRIRIEGTPYTVVT
jgi:hypothetical protein